MRKIFNNLVVKYLIVGWITTGIDILLFIVLCHFTFLGTSKLGVTLANTISILVSIILAYLANKHFVFNQSFGCIESEIANVSKFILSRLFTTVVEIAGVYIALYMFHQSKLVGKIEIQFVVVFLNYFLSKLIFQNK